MSGAEDVDVVINDVVYPGLRDRRYRKIRSYGSVGGDVGSSHFVGSWADKTDVGVRREDVRGD